MSNHLAGYSSAAYAGKALLVPGIPPIVGKYLLASGVLLAGAVLGRVLGTVTPAAASTNTGGSGTIASATLGAGAKAGVYQIICIEPAANLGTFEVEDPDGVIIGRAIVGTAFTGPINFTITDATDFVAGDRFTVTVALDGDDTVKLAATAATDGSQIAFGILVDDADASGGAVECLVYERADVMESALTFGTGHSTATVRDALRARGIHIIADA